MSGYDNPAIYARVIDVSRRNGVVYATVRYSNQSGIPAISRDLPVRGGEVIIEVGNQYYTVDVPYQPGYKLRGDSNDPAIYAEVTYLTRHREEVYATVMYYHRASNRVGSHHGLVKDLMSGKITISVEGQEFAVDITNHYNYNIYKRMAGSSNTLPFIYGRVLSIFPRNGQLYADVEHRDQSGRFVTSRNLPVKHGKVTIQVGNKKYAVNVTGNRNYDVLSEVYAGSSNSLPLIDAEVLYVSTNSAMVKYYDHYWGDYVTANNLPIVDGKVTVQIGGKKYAVDVTGHRNYGLMTWRP